ncbi:GNAT family N-acetyltransferase [Paractinoplanes lichenicola]|uniref:GNAT family N-acetyltransferase n=1 Tax=Paractinoplanes lichenicola TaxID=2802976 RepID=A0ABS1VKS8_9ACTN|nr:GNAT family protein [Actinoplanes lichenicola]MBL7255081.1 GNAT family N-acetyltransferase [Actinoplanes lichenicola]
MRSFWPVHAGEAVWDESAHTHWIVVDGCRCGFVRAFDLDDGTPLFDLRLASDCRGRGIGTAALGWLVGYLFGLLPGINRIEGTTRDDNRAMREVFRANGFAKEAHYREDWPGDDGTLHDTIGYALLRRDWMTGTTTPVRWAT